jgi:hypothetical protein
MLAALGIKSIENIDLEYLLCLLFINTRVLFRAPILPQQTQLHPHSHSSPVITMPLPENPTAVETGKALLSTLKAAFGTPPGYRAGESQNTLILREYTK